MVQTQSRPNPDASEGGIITTSVLVIMNLEGCDSGVVQCVAETQYVSRTVRNESMIKINGLGECGAWP